MNGSKKSSRTAQPVAELKRELITNLRHARNKRVPRSKGHDRRGQTPYMVSIHLRPPEIEDRQFPGHWEGDVIKGAANASAVGTLVEHTRRLLMLIMLPEFKPASSTNVMQAVSNKLQGIAAPMRQSMAYDQGREMAMHKKLSKSTGVAAYFCDPHSLWQLGSNENTNGLERQYLPRATTSQATVKSRSMLLPQINHRPRKGLRVRSQLGKVCKTPAAA